MWLRSMQAAQFVAYMVSFNAGRRVAHHTADYKLCISRGFDDRAMLKPSLPGGNVNQAQHTTYQGEVCLIMC